MRHRTDRWVKLAARGRFRMEAKARIGEKDHIEISAPKIERILNTESNAAADFHNRFRIGDLTADVNGAFIDDSQKTVFSINTGFQFIIRDVIFGTGQEIYVSENTGEAELVLTFQIGGDTPFQNKDINGIFSVYCKVGDIKFTGCMGNL